MQERVGETIMKNARGIQEGVMMFLVSSSWKAGKTGCNPVPRS
jgi:hypothetical protein